MSYSLFPFRLIPAAYANPDLQLHNFLGRLLTDDDLQSVGQGAGHYLAPVHECKGSGKGKGESGKDKKRQKDKAKCGRNMVSKVHCSLSLLF